MARLTRTQRRQQTRARLLEAAGQVFARRGFHTATVDEVADAAGYTKGAVYANFASKDDLVLALLDQHLAAQLQQVEALDAIESSEELRAALRARTEEEFAAARDVGVLLVEFSLYAMRNPTAQAELAKRYRQLRGRLAELITRRYARHQSAPPLPPEHLAALALATDAGLFLQDAAEPGALPWELHADAMLQLLDPPSWRSSEPGKTNLEPKTQTTHPHLDPPQSTESVEGKETRPEGI
jgi:AcrR family transcriptional regulator